MLIYISTCVKFLANSSTSNHNMTVRTEQVGCYKVKLEIMSKFFYSFKHGTQTLDWIMRAVNVYILNTESIPY